MEEVSKCLACGVLDSIRHTSDVGYCTECGTPENYEYVMVDEDGSEVYEPDKYGFPFGDHRDFW